MTLDSMYEYQLTESQHLFITSTQQTYVVEHLCEESSSVSASTETEEVDRIAIIVVSHQELIV